MAGIVFDITFTPGAGALGAFLEYHVVHPGGPSNPAQYAWVTNLNTPNSNVQGYFQITGSPMVLNDVPGMFPDFQENAVYEFRIRQVCPDGTEPLSAVEGDFWVPFCDRFTTGINPNIPIQQGPFGIDVNLTYRAGSSINSYIIELLNFAGTVIGTTTVFYNQMDQTGNTPFTYTFTNADLTPPNVLQGSTSYSVRVTIVLRTNTGTVQVANCATQSPKSPGCSSWIIETGDNWGLRWYDCNGQYHECYSPVPYDVTGLPIRICSPGIPQAFYCSAGVLQDGFVDDPTTGNVTLGGRVTQAAIDVCLPGYNNTGVLVYPNGAPVTCVTPIPCS